MWLEQAHASLRLSSESFIIPPLLPGGILWLLIAFLTGQSPWWWQTTYTLFLFCLAVWVLALALKLETVFISRWMDKQIYIIVHQKNIAERWKRMSYWYIQHGPVSEALQWIKGARQKVNVYYSTYMTLEAAEWICSMIEIWWVAAWVQGCGLRSQHEGTCLGENWSRCWWWCLCLH